MVCAPVSPPTPWLLLCSLWSHSTKVAVGNWEPQGVPHKHHSPGITPGDARAPLACHPKKPFYVSGETDPLSPTPRAGAGGTGRCRRSSFPVHCCPLRAVGYRPPAAAAAARPVLPSAFLQTQNSPRVVVGGCRGRCFLFLSRWGKDGDSQAGRNRGDVGAAAGAGGQTSGVGPVGRIRSILCGMPRSLPGPTQHPPHCHLPAGADRSARRHGPCGSVPWSSLGWVGVLPSPGGVPKPTSLPRAESPAYPSAARGVPAWVPLFPRKCQ